MSVKICDMPVEERPREKLDKYGAEILSSAELIAIILGSGTQQRPVLDLAHELIIHFGNLRDLAQATIAELTQVKGIGRAKAIQIKASCALAAKISKIDTPQDKIIRHPREVFDLLKEEMRDEKRERLVALLLDVKGKLIRTETVAIGTLTNIMVHPREVFYPAIRYKAASIILAHNHPSGDPTPSDVDILVTKEIAAAGELIGIPLKDHVIIGNKGYRSVNPNAI